MLGTRSVDSKILALVLTHDTVMNMRVVNTCVGEVLVVNHSDRASQRATLTSAKETNRCFLRLVGEALP